MLFFTLIHNHCRRHPHYLYIRWCWGLLLEYAATLSPRCWCEVEWTCSALPTDAAPNQPAPHPFAILQWRKLRSACSLLFCLYMKGSCTFRNSDSGAFSFPSGSSCTIVGAKSACSPFWVEVLVLQNLKNETQLWTLLETSVRASKCIYFVDTFIWTTLTNNNKDILIELCSLMVTAQTKNIFINIYLVLDI